MGGHTDLVLASAGQVCSHSIQDRRPAGEALGDLACQQHARVLPRRRGKQRRAGGEAGNAARDQWQTQVAAGLHVWPCADCQDASRLRQLSIFQQLQPANWAVPVNGTPALELVPLT